jgi:flagellar biosynthesis protein FliP
VLEARAAILARVRAWSWLAAGALFIVLSFGVANAPSVRAQEAPILPPDPVLAVDPPTIGEPDPLVDVSSPDAPSNPEDINIKVDSGDGTLSRTVVIILLMTVASIAPSVLLLTTCFTRFVITLSLTRNAIGAQTLPPTQVLVGLALFLTVFVMRPIFVQINDDAVQPMLRNEIEAGEAFEKGFDPLRQFMLRQVDDKDLALFVNLADQPKPQNDQDISPTTLIPAYVISELRHAFVIGFVIFVPFLIIDLVASSVLMSMGMVMLPPVFISLPLKLLLFVLVDGWNLVIGSVVRSVQGGT